MAQKQTKKKMDPDARICLECDSKLIKHCKCDLYDSECENGHKWHYCLKHNLRVNTGHDHTKKSRCTCIK
jgi:hypothetical protein